MRPTALTTTTKTSERGKTHFESKQKTTAITRTIKHKGTFTGGFRGNAMDMPDVETLAKSDDEVEVADDEEEEEEEEEA